MFSALARTLLLGGLFAQATALTATSTQTSTVSQLAAEEEFLRLLPLLENYETVQSYELLQLLPALFTEEEDEND